MQSTNFLSGLTSELAKRSIGTLFTPAFAFWTGGGTVIWQVWGENISIVTWFEKLSDVLQVSVLILLSVGIAMSGSLVQRFDRWALRSIEGYWPSFLNPLRRWLINRKNRVSKQLETRWQTLKIKEDKRATTPEESAELSKIELRQSQVPTNPSQRMPTRLGNILKAAELSPQTRYGLNSILCWPRLWMVLPELARQDISAARAELDDAARAWLWSNLFCFWALLAPFSNPFYKVIWPLPLGLLLATFSYRWALSATETYASLFQSAYDLYRFNLYEALRLDIPKSPEEEVTLTEKLNRYLMRGY